MFKYIIHVVATTCKSKKIEKKNDYKNANKTVVWSRPGVLENLFAGRKVSFSGGLDVSCGVVLFGYIRSVINK